LGGLYSRKARTIQSPEKGKLAKQQFTQKGKRVVLDVTQSEIFASGAASHLT